MNTDRLLRLADLLEADANNPKGVKFDLNYWGANKATRGDANFPQETKEIPVNCNTAACAVGLAAISDVFAAEGLGWVISAGSLIPTYAGYEDWPAVQAFFEIGEEVGYRLFSAGSYFVREGREAELAVARRIREAVADPSTLDDSSDDEGDDGPGVDSIQD